MPTTLSASEQIEQLQQQIEQLKHRSLLELKVKLAEARGAVSDLESQIEKITGTSPAKTGVRKSRTSITIDDVVRAIKGGASNYKNVADVLGCSAATVTNKIKAEGKAAGIASSGQKASFKLTAK
jgi:predicted transcriptional regulator